LSSPRFWHPRVCMWWKLHDFTHCMRCFPLYCPADSSSRRRAAQPRSQVLPQQRIHSG
jgi:hypothetical protein